MEHSAGLIMYRIKDGVEIFLVHPGGPYFVKIDKWGIPKGHVEENELTFDAAKREFTEETGIDLSEIKKYSFVGKFKCGRKFISAWAFENDFDGDVFSNSVQLEFPKNSGVIVEFPEIDKGKYFSIDDTKSKMHDSQIQIIEEFEKRIDFIYNDKG
jgi:predicted NUDIX family NTP pyrophosphohydrolase